MLLVFSLVVILISYNKTFSLAALTCFVSVAALISELHAVANMDPHGRKRLASNAIFFERNRKNMHYVEFPSHEGDI